MVGTNRAPGKKKEDACSVTGAWRREGEHRQSLR